MKQNKSTITFKGQQYPLVEIKYNDVFEGETECIVNVSVESLQSALIGNGLNEGDKEAKMVDERIFFYAEDEFLEKRPSYKELIGYIKESVN
jgi:hypothetical protein